MRETTWTASRMCFNPLDKVYGVQIGFPAVFRVHVDYNRSVDELFWLYRVQNTPLLL
jgi:hypothetical protein